MNEKTTVLPAAWQLLAPGATPQARRDPLRRDLLFRSVNRHGRVSDRRLTDHAVAVVVKRSAKKAGLAPELFSGHSLRAGFVTEAKKNGADDAAIMDSDREQEPGHGAVIDVSYFGRWAPTILAGDRQVETVCGER